MKLKEKLIERGGALSYRPLPFDPPKKNQPRPKKRERSVNFTYFALVLHRSEEISAERSSDAQSRIPWELPYVRQT